VTGSTLVGTPGAVYGCPMPTVQDLLLDPISLIVIALYAGLWGLEALFPGRALPRVPGARARGVLWFALYFLVSSYLPYLWSDVIAPFRCFDLTNWPLPLAVLVGMLSYELLAYGYHRSLHASDFLFRNVHQMHHSAERLDVASAFYFHPLDIIGWTAVTSLGLSVLVGLSPQATGNAVLLLTFLSVFQHANLRTPRWLGYLVQRPESHSRHHGRGWHRNNYADLPIVDLLFGTFENPSDFEAETGYYDGASAEVGSLLLGRSLTESLPPLPKVAGPRA
jgi:sterol desaturase/sphingolipid hydroxylase (fatty acid hydroxylase superfamily)